MSDVWELTYRLKHVLFLRGFCGSGLELSFLLSNSLLQGSDTLFSLLDGVLGLLKLELEVEDKLGAGQGRAVGQVLAVSHVVGVESLRLLGGVHDVVGVSVDDGLVDDGNGLGVFLSGSGNRYTVEDRVGALDGHDTGNLAGGVLLLSGALDDNGTTDIADVLGNLFSHTLLGPGLSLGAGTGMTGDLGALDDLIENLEQRGLVVLHYTLTVVKLDGVSDSVGTLDFHAANDRTFFPLDGIDGEQLAAVVNVLLAL